MTTDYTRTHECFIKVVNPGFYKIFDAPILGFPPAWQRKCTRYAPGTGMFIYVTQLRRVIGLVETTGWAKRTGHGHWPFGIPAVPVLGPKPGLTLAEAGLSIRPMPGDTLFDIDGSDADRLYRLLLEQRDLSQSELDELNDKFDDEDEVDPDSGQ